MEEKKQQNAREEKAIKEQIETVAKDALAIELMASQIKDTAIQSIDAKVEEQQKSSKEKAIIENIETVAKNALSAELIASQTKNLAKQIISNLIKKHSALIQTIIAIKKAAIATVTSAVTPKDITELIKQTAIEKVNTLVLEEQLYDEFEKNKVIIEPLNILQKELENIAIQTTLSSLPKIAEPKNDVESSIKNTAINALKDSVMTNVIEYNKYLVNINDRLIDTMITKDLENIAKTTLVNELLKKSVPGSSTGSNIENDLKHAALTALYSALLGVSKEHVDPSKPPSEYDILITDKTYDYKDGKQTEIPELTKYDSILAK